MTYITSDKWNKLSYTEQILNIGGEIQRAVDNRNAKKEESIVEQHYELALEWIKLTKKDPKNKDKLEEIKKAEEELIDYFENNDLKNDKVNIMSFWDSFLSVEF